jgi:hypothetical protein
VPEWLLAAAVLLLFFVVGAVFAILQRRRAQALARTAESLGLEAVPEGQALPHELGRLGLFQSGRHRTSANVLRGEAAGGELRLFDYSFSTGRGGSADHQEQTVAAVRLPGKALPAFEATPEGALGWLGSALGAQDIAFPAHPRFSSRYRVQSEDEEAVRELLDLDALRLLEAWEPRPTVEARGEWLVVYRKEQRLKPGQIPDLVRAVTRLAEVLAHRARPAR